MLIILQIMHGRGPEIIPMKKGTPRSKDLGNSIEREERRRQKIPTTKKLNKEIQTGVQIIFDSKHILTCGLLHQGPRFFEWFENPMNMETMNTFTDTMERMLPEKPIFLIQVSPSGRANILIQLRKNPSGSYNIHSAQCEYSRMGIIGFLSFLGNAEEAGVTEDCPRYQELCNFFETLHIDKKLIGGLDDFL